MTFLTTGKQLSNHLVKGVYVSLSTAFFQIRKCDRHISVLVTLGGRCHQGGRPGGWRGYPPLLKPSRQDLSGALAQVCQRYASYAARHHVCRVSGYRHRAKYLSGGPSTVARALRPNYPLSLALSGHLQTEDSPHLCRWPRWWRSGGGAQSYTGAHTDHT